MKSCSTGHVRSKQDVNSCNSLSLRNVLFAGSRAGLRSTHGFVLRKPLSRIVGLFSVLGITYLEIEKILEIWHALS